MKKKAADIKNRNDLFNELEKSDEYRNSHAFSMNNGDTKSFEEMDKMFLDNSLMTEDYYPIFTFEKTAMKKTAAYLIGSFSSPTANYGINLYADEYDGSHFGAAMTNTDGEELEMIGVPGETEEDAKNYILDAKPGWKFSEGPFVPQPLGNIDREFAPEFSEVNTSFDPGGTGDRSSMAPGSHAAMKKKAGPSTATGYKADGETRSFTGTGASDAFDQAVAWGAQRIVDGQGAIYLPISGEWTQINDLGAMKKKADEDRYKSDAEIESGYDGMKVEEFHWYNEGHSGVIYITFAGGAEEKTDNFIIYDDGRIAFDNWYPEKIVDELTEYIKAQGSQKSTEFQVGDKVRILMPVPENGGAGRDENTVAEVTKVMDSGKIHVSYTSFSGTPIGSDFDPKWLEKVGMKRKADSPAQYLHTFFEEKDLIPQSWEIEGNDGQTHFVDSDVVIEAIMGASTGEQEQIANVIRKIDFANGDVNDYLKHLATGLVNGGHTAELHRRGPVPEIELGKIFE